MCSKRGTEMDLQLACPLGAGCRKAARKCHHPRCAKTKVSRCPPHQKYETEENSCLLVNFIHMAHIKKINGTAVFTAMRLGTLPSCHITPSSCPTARSLFICTTLQNTSAARTRHGSQCKEHGVWQQKIIHVIYKQKILHLSVAKSPSCKHKNECRESFTLTRN